MRISDKTLYRNENGQINLMGRLESTFKFGFGWYSEVMAQEKIIAVFSKILDRNYIMLRNFSLPETDFNIPLLLIGPPGIFLISVLNQGGLFSVRDDEWGRLAGETFIAMRPNPVQSLIKLGRVVKFYLERNGFKGELTLEPILIAANPGMHIETLRPAARVVLNDAVERFVISLTQARPILNADRIADIAVALVKGPPDANAFVPEHGVLVSSTVPGGKEIRDKLNPPEATEEELPTSFSSDSLGFSYDEHGNEEQGGLEQKETSSDQQAGTDQNAVPRESSTSTAAFTGFDGDFGSFKDNQDTWAESNDTQTDSQSASNVFKFDESDDEASNSGADSGPAQKLRFGMTRGQLLVLVGIMVVWLLMVAAFVYIINL